MDFTRDAAMLRRFPLLSLPRLRPPGRRRPLLALLAGTVLLSIAPSALAAASNLLESVKQNPALARNLCSQFKQLNAQGISATSRQSIERVAASQNLSPLDAEVLTTYVIGLHCPDVR